MVVQRGCYYEELQIGVTYVHSPGWTVDDADNTAFSTMTNMQSLPLEPCLGAD